MTGRWMIGLGLVALCATARPLAAQARQGRIETRLGMAVAAASTTVVGSTSKHVGPLLAVQIGLVQSPTTDFTLDLAVQPFASPNPQRDEAFTGIYGMFGLQVGLGARGRTFVRPEVGLVHRSWSGSGVAMGSEWSPAAGAAAGREVTIGRIALAPEAFVRVSGAKHLTSVLGGLNVSVVAAGARQSRAEALARPFARHE